MQRNQDGSAGDIMFALEMLWSELELSSASTFPPHRYNLVSVGEGEGGGKGLGPDMGGGEGRRRSGVDLVVEIPPPPHRYSADQGCEWVQELQASMRQVVAAVEVSTRAVNRQGDLCVCVHGYIYMYIYTHIKGSFGWFSLQAKTRLTGVRTCACAECTRACALSLVKANTRAHLHTKFAPSNQRALHVPKKSPALSQKSPIYSQKSPTYSQKSPTYSQKSPTHSQKSPISVKKNQTYPSQQHAWTG